MSGKNVTVTRDWICICNRQNPLHFVKCESCGKKIPARIKKQIYREEINIQKFFFANIVRNKIMKRLQKKEALLKKQRMLIRVLPFILIVLLVFLVHNGDMEIQTIQTWSRLTDIEAGVTGVRLAGRKLDSVRLPENEDEIRALSEGGKKFLEKLNDMKQKYQEKSEERKVGYMEVWEERKNQLQEKKEYIENYVNG